MNGIVYCCTNKINGHRYVGQTIQTLEKRIIAHRAEMSRGSNFPIHNALRKYGAEKFSWETMAFCEDRDNRDSLENFYIRYFGSKRPDGYNLTDGGDGRRGPQSDESKIKMSETWSRIGHPMTGKHHSEETKKKISEAKIGCRGTRNGMHCSEEMKDKIRKTHTGFHHTEETKKKISSLFKGDKHPLFGVPCSEERKQKIRDSLNAYYLKTGRSKQCQTPTSPK
jgi:group I intron endonuclease